jgi:uncharacterized protein (DUF1778 family)
MIYKNVEMPTQQTQISAYISKDTKDLVERYARAHGVKKAFLIESALLHHLQALHDLPADVIIPPRLVVSRKSGEKIIERIRNPLEPAPALDRLLAEPVYDKAAHGND